METTMPKSPTIYDTVTAAIVKALERDPGKLAMPWHRGQSSLMPENAVTGTPYRGVNVVALWAAADDRRYPAGRWATYKAWASIGAQVRRGETGTAIAFFKEYTVERDPDDPDDTGKRATARGYTVFNIDQVDGAPPLPDAPDQGPIQRAENFQRMVEATGAVIHVGGSRAFYAPGPDIITMPSEHLWHGSATRDRHESFASVLAHELGHFSGHPSRLDRDWSKRGYKLTEAVAMEELTAEICAAQLCATLGFSTEPRIDHAQYLASWITLLKNDNRAIFKAAAAAARAADFIRGVTQTVEPPEANVNPPEAPVDIADQTNPAAPNQKPRTSQAGFLISERTTA